MRKYGNLILSAMMVANVFINTDHTIWATLYRAFVAVLAVMFFGLWVKDCSARGKS